MKNGKIILVGGGTGGHIFPLIAVAEQLNKENKEFVFIGTRDSLEEKTVTVHKWPFIAIDAGKWRRYSSPLSFLNNIVDIFRGIAGFFQSIRILRSLRARVVLSKGGYVALPVLYAARVIGCPVIIHESDSVMGVTNKIGSKFAKYVLTAFDTKVFPEHDQRYQRVGIPVRRSLLQASTLRSPKKVRPLILILPGSQGSTAINKFLKDGLTKLLEKYDIVHLTGKTDYSTFVEIKKQLSKDLADRYRPFDFIDRELPYYFQSADLIIARASATTAAEAAIFAKPLYLVPLPSSANNHQEINAKLLEEAGAAVVRQQYQLSAEGLISDVNGLLSNPTKTQEIGRRLSQYFSTQDATMKIVKLIDDVQS